MHKTPVQTPGCSKVIPIDSAAPVIRFIKITPGKKENKLDVEMESSPTSPNNVAYQYEKDYMQSNQVVSLHNTEEDFYNLPPLPMAAKPQSEVHNVFPTCQARLKHGPFFRGAVPSRMLEVIAKKAKTMKEKQCAICRKKLKTHIFADHSSTPDTMIVEQNVHGSHAVLDEIHVADMDMVKEFSRYPTAIPTFKHIVSAKQYKVFYKWTDVSPVITSANEYLFKFSV